MKTIARVFSASAFVAVAGALPAMAQATNGTGNTQAAPPANQPKVGMATINPTGIPPSQRNPLLADNGDVRISKVIDTDIYNKNDKNIGSVDDILVGTDGQLQAVVSTNNKKVLVPWNQLQFGDAKLNTDNKILMPDETQAMLNAMPSYDYTKQGK